MDDLKPCPFCGGDVGFGYFAGTANIHCGACRYEMDADDEEAPEAFKARWNTRAAPKVKPGEIERIVWAAMVWARENPGPDEVPEYTDGGNSFAEAECRATVRRIREALE